MLSRYTLYQVVVKCHSSSLLVTGRYSDNRHSDNRYSDNRYSDKSIVEPFQYNPVDGFGNG